MSKRRVVRRLPPWGAGVQAALALGAVAAVGHLAGLHALWGLAAGAVAALCCVLAEAGREGGAVPARIWVQLVRCAAVAAWLGWSWTVPGDLAAVLAARWGLDATGEPLSLRSEEHTSELQSRENIVCRLLLEKKKNQDKESRPHN